jgi:hypothetical protein
MRKRTVLLVTWLGLALNTVAVPPVLRAAGGAPAPWYGQEFSATLVRTFPRGPAGKRTARLFVGSTGMRLEDPQGLTYIYDARAGRTWILFPGRKQFVETKGPGPLADLLPKPGGNPCAGIADRNVTCRKTGSERVNGRLADRWELQFRVGDKKLVAFRWVDRQLGVPVRVVTYEGAKVDLTDVRVARQPGSLFRIPPDYRPGR